MYCNPPKPIRRVKVVWKISFVGRKKRTENRAAPRRFSRRRRAGVVDARSRRTRQNRPRAVWGKRRTEIRPSPSRASPCVAGVAFVGSSRLVASRRIRSVEDEGRRTKDEGPGPFFRGGFAFARKKSLLRRRVRAGKVVKSVFLTHK